MNEQPTDGITITDSQIGVTGDHAQVKGGIHFHSDQN